MRFKRHLVSLIGMLERLFGAFMSSLVVFFAVVDGSGAVRLRGAVMELGGSNVRIARHLIYLQFRLAKFRNRVIHRNKMEST